jgi:hypothetical protein
MSSEMERALDEILSGVNELLTKAPALSDQVRQSHGLDAATVAAVPDETAGLLALFAHLESDPSHSAQPLARRLLNRMLVQRALPMSGISGVPAGLSVSPQMHRAVMRLAALGAVWLGAEGGEMYWDCGMLSNAQISAALGTLVITVQLDPERQNRMLCLPRTPERMPLVVGSPAQLCPGLKLDHLQQVAVVDQDKTNIQRSTIFWLEQRDLLPSGLCGTTLISGRLIPVVNPISTQPQ